MRLTAMTEPNLDGLDVIHLDIPPRYLRLTGAIRGYWRRELAVLVVVLLVGVIAGVLLAR